MTVIIQPAHKTNEGEWETFFVCKVCVIKLLFKNMSLAYPEAFQQPTPGVNILRVGKIISRALHIINCVFRIWQVVKKIKEMLNIIHWMLYLLPQAYRS